MIYAGEYGGGDTYSTDTTPSTPPLGVALSVDYWVLDEAGRLAAPACVDALPGANRTDSPYSIVIETPVCGTCGELRAALIERLRQAATAASDQGCRLLAVGVRPDQLRGGQSGDDLLADRQQNDGQLDDGQQAGDQQDGLPSETASTRIRFETDPETATTIYNVLLALDPAFVLLESTGEDSPASARRAALMDNPNQGIQGYRTTHPPVGDGIESTRLSAGAGDHWQPVAMVDESTVEWRSLAALRPTLLVDLIGDVVAILQQATECQIEIGTYGNGFEVGCLSLPSAAWRQRYLEDAIEDGLTSLRLRAYLDRLGFEVDWYRHVRRARVGGPTDRDRRARCRRRADLLAADLLAA